MHLWYRWYISSTYQYVHIFSTCTLHMWWNSSRIDCNKDSLVTTDFAHKSWHMARTALTLHFLQKIFSCIFHSGLLRHCISNPGILLPKLLGCAFVIFLLPYMYSWLWAKLDLCQYKSTMVTRRAQDQVNEKLKQPYQTTVSIEWLPCSSLIQQVTIFIDAARYHEVCKKKCNYLRRDSRFWQWVAYKSPMPL